MKICKIKENYINYLRNFDNRVLINKNETRPYVGILFKIGKIKYFAQLSSPKLKHKDMKTSIDFIKIENGKYGAINLNNMIPVLDEVIIDLNIDSLKDKKYKELLYNQLNYVNSKAKFIVKKASMLYVKVSNFNGRLNKRCVNFKLLENEIEYYKGENDL